MSCVTYLKLVGYRGIIDKAENNAIHNITIKEGGVNNSIKQFKIEWYKDHKNWISKFSKICLP